MGGVVIHSATCQLSVLPRRPAPGVVALGTVRDTATETDTEQIEAALAVLQANPYGPTPSAEQEQACRVIYRALIGRLSVVCRRLGLDDEEVANVLHPELHQFFTRDVCRIGPTRADLERWMITVCRNAARTAMSMRRRRDDHYREAVRVLEIEAEPDDAEPTRADVMAAGSDEPQWLDTTFPGHVDRDRFVAALDTLTPRERILLDVAFRYLGTRDGRRLPATEIARELGTTPGSVSVRWSELLAKLRRACGASPAEFDRSSRSPSPNTASHVALVR
jgi:RNA polymerase sigma factor (sigma-70 family)